MSTIALVWVVTTTTLAMSARGALPDFCTIGPDSGPCGDQSIVYYYDIYTHDCQEIIYGGCAGSVNRFNSLQECADLCKKNYNVECLLPAASGNCDAHIPKFHFNKTTSRCEMFIYGGCGGNTNRFDSKAECETKCPVPLISISDYACLLQPDPGLCKAYMPRYFYNVTSGKCEIFIYGGCGGNDNRYNTMNECQQHCRNALPQRENFCLLQPETGPCRAVIPRFFYNVTTRSCENFTYGGCGGNNNRFKTKESCMERCQDSQDPINICLLPADSGLCYGHFPQHFYNSTSKMCQEFIYGGCGGNDNWFGSEKTCQEKCP